MQCRYQSVFMHTQWCGNYISVVKSSKQSRLRKTSINFQFPEKFMGHVTHAQFHEEGGGGPTLSGKFRYKFPICFFLIPSLIEDNRIWGQKLQIYPLTTLARPPSLRIILFSNYSILTDSSTTSFAITGWRALVVGLYLWQSTVSAVSSEIHKFTFCQCIFRLLQVKSVK